MEDIDREEALKKVVRKKDNRRPVLAVAYDPRQPDIPGIMTTAYKAASSDYIFKKSFPEKPLIAYRKQKTIGDNLIRAVLHPLPRAVARTRTPKPGFKKCGKCMLDHYVTNSTKHLASATGEEFPITSSITCTTKNVIYDLWCNKCRNCLLYTSPSPRDS